MKLNMIAALAFGSFLGALPVASFADNDHNRWNNDRGGHWQQDRRDHDRGHSRWQDDRRDWRRHDDRRREVIVVRDHRHSARPYRDWHRGEYLPATYRHQNYYVRDWRSSRLHEPPRGYRWVNVNGDYLLVSIVSNVIAQILVGR